LGNSTPGRLLAAGLFCGPNRLVRLLALFLAGLLLAAAQPVPAGSSKISVVAGGVPLDVYTHKPANYRGGPLILVFHGVQRNAEDYRDWAVVLAERFGAIVAAPHFDKERFSVEAYQRGGVIRDGVLQPAERWTYAKVPALIAALRAREGRPDLPVTIIGHSAGGQFVQRMAALFPEHGAVRVVAANPGSHIFPRTDWPYGFGFGGLGADDAMLRRYLAAPLTLYLGTGDTDPNHPSLTRDEDSMRQGPHRYARGQALWDYAQKLARERGWPCHWRKVETPGIAHDAAKMFAAKEVEDALFGTD